MTPFTPFDYLLIDAANQFGLDKALFEVRIQWALKHLHELEDFTQEADEPALYLKAVMAIRKAQKGIPTGHLVGLDATCSGLQVMSALTGCIKGANATGFVDPNRRADAYTDTTKMMSKILGGEIEIPRKDVKNAVMTRFYGSTQEPEALFGQNTKELKAFYQAVEEIAPGPSRLLVELLESWDQTALHHSWRLPDGFDAHVKVMGTYEFRPEIEELGGASFTYQVSENMAQERGKANAANAVHSVDGYILRSIIRRCDYDPETVMQGSKIIAEEIGRRARGNEREVVADLEPQMEDLLERYDRTQMADVVILPLLTASNVKAMTDTHLHKLTQITEEMLEHKPFRVVTVHDEFKCHPNHMNVLRQQYINLFAELADSTVLEDILSELYQMPIEEVNYQKFSNNLSEYIRESNYALC